jgi:hypothetical protein
VLRSAAVRYFGPVPPRGAPELQRLRWTRALGLKLALPFLPVIIAAAVVINETRVYVLLVAWAVLWGGSLARLERDIRRVRRAETAD